MKLLRLKATEAAMFGLFALYAFYFVNSVAFGWFNPQITTDDARQQTFPLYRALNAEAFRGDPITESMMGYLSPIHWWVSYAITLVTRSPVMTGHVVMFIQLMGTLVFLYKLVEYLGGRVPGLFAVTWYLHTRGLPARMTGGLPRGWAGLVLVAFLYYLIRRRHGGVLAVLLFGILTNPPAAFMCAACYGLFLVIDVARNRRSAESFQPLVRYIIVCPIFAAIAYFSLQRPPEFGHMHSLAEAKANPAFSRSGGRFPFVPLAPVWKEVRNAGMQAFFPDRRERNGDLSDYVTGALLAFIVLIAIWDQREKHELIPLELKVFFISIFTIYFLSRAFAFHLYVPDRHIQFPLNTFWIIAGTILVWRAFHKENSPWRPTAALFGLAMFLYLLNGWALGGTANFNTHTTQLQPLYTYIREKTPIDSVIAGNPRDIDGVQLYAMRPGYITDETAHPFYTGFWKLVKNRLKVSFRAYYAPNLKAFLHEIGDEKIDYFYFNRSRYNPEVLKRATYSRPFTEHVKKLAAKAESANIAQELADPKFRPAIAFDDGDGVLLDVKKLREIVLAAPVASLGT